MTLPPMATPRLFFSMKHQGWDYWRYVAFNPTIGIGRHQQIVEASCQRSYEGKGIWPSYIARGVIEGFAEQAENVNYTGGVKGLRDVVGNSNVVGLWTWSRGDGNYGPYTKAGELWQTVNCRVLAAWANDTSRTEEDLFLETVRNLPSGFGPQMPRNCFWAPAGIDLYLDRKNRKSLCELFLGPR